MTAWQRGPHTRPAEAKAAARVRRERAEAAAEREPHGRWCDACWTRHPEGECEADTEGED